MLIPLAVIDDVAILDPRTHNNMLHPVYVLFDSRTMSHYHHPTSTTPPPWSVNMYNNVPRRLMSHYQNNVPRRLMSHNQNNVPRRLMSHNHNHVPRSMSHNRNNVSSRFTSSTSRNNVSSRFTSSTTVSVVDETLVYDSTITNNIPRTRSFNLHHHNNGTRASSSPVIGVQEHVTTSTTDAESICCICLVHLSNASSTPIRLRCSHLFHTECIQKWVNIRQTCPLCRADV
ncbi:unnamed protein product [Vicia faba]|uniref:RING-type domain-containing protein n=1 Tax=Vicia faba TaxID=3906 RepID=A0AAV1AD93_VICFA|nr:unnamed protein product [Vicia faba]